MLCNPNRYSSQRVNKCANIKQNIKDCGWTAFRGFIWKWHGKSFGWAQEDNLNGAVPLCCFFLSFLGNIHSNSEYTMKKKTKMKHVQKEYTFRKIHLSCDGEDCGPLLPQAKMYCWQNYKANRPACLLPRQGCAENEFLTLSAQCTAMYFTTSTKERFQVSLVKALFFLLWKGLVSVPSVYPIVKPSNIIKLWQP